MAESVYAADLKSAAERRGGSTPPSGTKERAVNWTEYNKLFHELELNRVAFKQLMDCDQEVLKLVNAAIAAEREACAKVCDGIDRRYINQADKCAAAIRARSE